MSEVNTVILDFVNAAINNGIAQEEGNANQANKYYRIIEKRAKWLIEHYELSNPLFLELVKHQNDYVKFHVSCFLLHSAEDIALDTLKSLTEKRGILGFSAKMTISEYVKGNI